MANAPRVPTISAGQCCETTAPSGSLTRVLRSSVFWKSGVSVMLRRTHSPVRTSNALAKNGTRQPHCMNCASSSTAPMPRKVPVDNRNPSGPPSCGNMPYHTRLPGGAFSVASSTAPPHSPPKPSPGRSGTAPATQVQTRRSARNWAAGRWPRWTAPSSAALPPAWPCALPGRRSDRTPPSPPAARQTRPQRSPTTATSPHCHRRRERTAWETPALRR